MKTIFLAFCGLIFFGVDASPYASFDSALALDPACAKGQTYWCQNLATAKKCRATRHCIKAVWEKQEYPVDNDSICQICLDMVKQARDQLRSNETQEELKEVFEGTCEFIRIKSIRKECDKLADDFVPELVEALSSQMNPQVVCSVSGLCNNAAIDKELAKHSKEMVIKKQPISTSKGLTCSQCNFVSNIISTKFANTNRDQMLENLLMLCGQMSSLSDGCSAIVLSYYNEIYDHLTDNLNAENICHMSGVCADLYHQHDDDDEDKIEVIEDSRIGVVEHVKDDIPCDLCKQLVMHLRDLLVANTTESEFKDVLEGICKQTKSFKQECLGLVDQYYDLIYAKLTKELDAGGACFLIGVCPKGLLLQEQQQSYEIAPLVPSSQLLVKKKILGEDEPVFSNEQIQSFQLPKDVLLLDTEQLQAHIGQTKGNQFCTLCEYFLHFVQEALASPANEEDIKDSVLKMCTKVKKSFEPECQQFVDMYGDAVIALLIQEIDPAQVCPKLALCSKRTTPTANEKCPLCLFLIQDVEEKLKHNKSKQNIEDELHRICEHLSDSLKAECDDFINTYTPELVDKLANNFTPREICLYLKCCTEKEEVLIEKIGDKASYNDYLTNTVYQIESEQTSIPECLLCEELVKQVEKKIKNNKSKEHIKQVLEGACEALPKNKLKQKCLAAIEKNADFIINLLIKEVTPREVCLAIGFCFASEEFFDVVPLQDIYTCRTCKIVVQKIEQELNNKTAQEDVKNCVKHICYIAFPGKCPFQAECKKFVDAYANEIIKYIPNEPPQEVCAKACVCPKNNDEFEVEDDFDSEFAVVPLSETKPKPSDATCRYCKVVVQKIEKELNNKTAQEDIEKYVKHICDHYPKKLQSKCQQFIDSYANEIIKYIPNESPQEVCEKVNICPNSDDEIQLEDESDTGFTAPECIVCEQLVKEVEKKVKDDKSRQHIKEVLEQACQSFHKKDLEQKCVQIVEKNADYIVDSIIKQVTPKEICHGLGFCASKPTETDTKIMELSIELMRKYADTPQCVLCELIATKLETQLKANKTQDEIENAVRQFCKSLPAKVAPKCNDFIKNYAELIIDLVTAVPPKEICGELNFCRENLKQDTAEHDILECGVCYSTVDALATVLEKHGSKEKTIVTETTCNLLPAKYHQDCESLMHVYGISLTTLIKRNEKLSDICGKIGKCFQDGDNSMFVEIHGENTHKTQTSRPLLGANNKCTFGPSYWCSNEANMKECNAQKFCNTRYNKTKMSP